MSAGEGLYAVDAQLLHHLKPDVIITQSLCSVCSVDASLVHRIAAEMRDPHPEGEEPVESLEEVILGTRIRPCEE